MNEITGDLFESEKADAICITTNGFVNAQGANTMGRGCAGEAKARWPGIQMTAGRALGFAGNRVVKLTYTEQGQIFLPECRKPLHNRHYVPYHVVTFPTKPDLCNLEDLLPYYQRRNDQGASPHPGWKAKSNLDMIAASACQLVGLVGEQGWQSVVLPRPGCGAGELSWEDEVRPILSRILDGRFYTITFPPR